MRSATAALWEKQDRHHGDRRRLFRAVETATNASTDLGLPDEGFDLLISLYAGLVSEHCTRHLRIGGQLLVNPSHGDAARASIDPRYELTGVILSRSHDYVVSNSALDTYLVPRRPTEVTVDLIKKTGRGIVYTKSPFAYMFTRID